MITYHHYFPNLDLQKLAKDFNSTIKNYAGFSEKIVISRLGDGFERRGQSKAEEVQTTFKENWGTLFEGVEMTPTERRGTYQAEVEGKEIEIRIGPVDTRVYPLGRFRDYLTSEGILEQYEEQFKKRVSDYVCPDLIKWPGIILEPNGDLNLCASFEAITCPKAVVTNIFEKQPGEVERDLMQFHQRELNWFTRNIDDIVAGKVSTCKLKNHCYRD